jgi:Enolase C-terminal domain-like
MSNRTSDNENIADIPNRRAILKSALNVTLDLTNPNFGIHEHFGYTPLVEDIFHGCLQVKDGYAWINENPGWGIEVDEALAAKHPITDDRPNEMRTTAAPSSKAPAKRSCTLHNI